MTSTARRGTAATKLMLLTLACGLAIGARGAEDREKQQKQIQNMAQDTLQRLYNAEPKSKAAVKHAAGYAVFSDLGVKILFAGSGNGKGIAVNNRNKHVTYMKMLEVQAGLGVGVDKYRVVFVFENEQALNHFVDSGWEFGGQTTAAAEMGAKGAAMSGAVSVADGVWMYQLTETGLAADISATGTKYYKDDDLN